MEKEKVVLKKKIIEAAEKDGIREIVIREGKASDIIPEIKDQDVTLFGIISSCSEFYKKRPKQFALDRAHIIYSKNPEKLSITLKTNEHKEKPHYSITGKLETSEELNAFGIAYKSSQIPKAYSVADLSKMLRFNKRLFFNAEESNKIIEGLAKFKAKVDATVSSSSDNRGNQSGSFDIKVDSGIPMLFTVIMPLFKGKPARKFIVDILFELKGVKEISLWLESIELANLIQEDANNYINEELKQMSEIVQIEI